MSEPEQDASPLLSPSPSGAHPERLFFNFYLFLEREREKGGGREEVGDRERNIDLLFHLFMHHWLILLCALTGD